MAATCARSLTLVNFGSAIMAKKPMIATTVSSSMSVNPARFMGAEGSKPCAVAVPGAGGTDMWRLRSGPRPSLCGTSAASWVFTAS